MIKEGLWITFVHYYRYLIEFTYLPLRKTQHKFAYSSEAACAPRARPGDQVPLTQNSGTGASVLKATFLSETLGLTKTLVNRTHCHEE